MLSFRLKHPNIIELLGFSNETPDTLCLIYPYMAEGTLKDALVKCKNPEANFVLSSNQRIGIMKGKTWVLVLGQGNLVGLERKAPGFFSQSVKSEKLLKKCFFVKKIGNNK